MLILSYDFNLNGIGCRKNVEKPVGNKKNGSALIVISWRKNQLMIANLTGRNALESLTKLV